MRAKGTFNESSNYEGKFAWTIDARNMVQSYADLLAFTPLNYIPNGFPVAVFDVDANKRGIYICVNKNDLSNPASWQKQSFDSTLYYTSAQVDEILENFTPGSGGVGSREYNFSVGANTLIESFQLFCSGTERPVSIFITSGQTIDFSYEGSTVYALLPSLESEYLCSVIIMGTPEGTPAPTNGIVSSNPNEFTFTPSDITDPS